jgi:hypothetical protein
MTGGMGWSNVMAKKNSPSGNTRGTVPMPEEPKEISPRLKKHYDRLRKKYSEVRGRRVDWIDFSFTDGLLYVGVRFMDGTYFSLVFGSQIITDLVEFSDMSSGDDEILKTYSLRKKWN